MPLLSTPLAAKSAGKLGGAAARNPYGLPPEAMQELMGMGIGKVADPQYQQKQLQKRIASLRSKYGTAPTGRSGPQGVQRHRTTPRTSQPQVQKGSSPLGKPQSRIQTLLQTGRAQRKGRGAATFGGLPGSAQPQPTFHKSLTMARPGQDPRKDVYGGRRFGGARSKRLR